MRPLGTALGTALVACVLASGACTPTLEPEASDAPIAPPGNLPGTTVGPVDPVLMRDKLAGSWVVRRARRVILEFTLDGDHIALVDHRFPTPRKLEGTFRVRSSTGFGVETADGTTYWYAVGWDGPIVHIGLGTIIEVGDATRFTAQLGAWERLVRTPDGCTYVRTWGGDERSTEVPCEVVERGDRKIFTFEAEDPYRPDRLKKVELDLVGGYLMERELGDSIAVPRVVYEREATDDAGEEPEVPAEDEPPARPL